MQKIFYIIGVAMCLSACKNYVAVQQKSLYDAQELVKADEIYGFKALYIFNDEIDKSVWVSPEKQCVTLQSETKNTHTNAKALHIKWDKVTGGCKWIGLGFGWNNWIPKDMGDLIDDCAVQMQVKSVKGTFNNLPVAFAFEDYGNVQAFYGYEKTLSSGNFNDSTWTSVTIPLKKFPFKEKDFNTESVKQFMIQLEGDGDIYLDNIKLVRL